MRTIAHARVPRSVLALWVASGLLLLAPAALAAQPVSAVLEPDGPVLIEGRVRAVASDATLQVVPAEGAGEVFVLEAPEGAVRIVRSEREAIANPVSGDAWLPPEHSTESFPLTSARVVVRDPEPGFLGLLTPAGHSTLELALEPAARGLAASAELKEFVIGPRKADAYPYYFRHEVPAGSFLLACVAAGAQEVRAHGQVQVALVGAVLEVTSAEGARTVRLGEWDEPVREAGGLGVTYKHVTAFAILALRDARVEPGPGTLLDYYSRAPTLAVEGRVVLEGAHGYVRADRVVAQPRGERVELEGQLLVRAARVEGEPDLLGEREGRTTVEVEGQSVRAIVGGRELVAPPEVQAAAGPVAALAAVVVAWLSGAGPKLLALALMPAYAGATPEVLLENERRRAIYQAVLRNPGVHMRELQRVTGLRWGSLQYHAAVLLGMGLLTAARSGRRTVLACDVHGLSPEQLRALHLLRGARASRVAQAVAAGHAVTQRDVMQAAHVSARLVSRYLAIMAELGLVEVAPGRPKRYHSTTRMAELLPRVADRHLPPA